MALTPEDVVNKRFQPTKFREGYDQDEVDDFLDEVVVELRRLNQENEELRQRLVAAEARVSEAAKRGPPRAAPRRRASPSRPPRRRTVAGARRSAAPPQSRARRADPHDQPAAARSPPPRGARARGRREARRAHRRGPRHRRARRRRGRGQAARRRSASLDQERVALENRIDELRIFERDYRPKLQELHRGPAARPRHRAAPGAGLRQPGLLVAASARPGAAGDQPAPSFQGFGG